MLMTDEEVIEAARVSPAAFVTVVLAFEMTRYHVDMQRFWTAHDECHQEHPRGHGKTSQVLGRCAFEIGRNPDIRIKYVQHVKDKAVESVRALRHILESDTFRIIFPEVIPDEENWGAESFTVKRGQWSRDPTVQAEGINGRAGGRFDLLVGDDICDVQNSIQKPAEREKVKEAWQTNWLPMADYARGTPRIWTIGTPYHVADITADWRAYHGKRGSLMRCPVTGGFDSPWPEVWTPDILRAQRESMGPVAFARAYELQPVSNELLIFLRDWIDSCLYESRPPRTRVEVIAAFDFAYTEKALKLKGAKGATDPDWSVCIIAERDNTGHLWLKDMLRLRATYPEFRQKALALCERHGVKRAAGEGNGPQAGIVQDLNSIAPFPVMSMDRLTDKITRAVEKQAFVESKRLHIPGEPLPGGGLEPTALFRPLYDEMLTFPAGNHDDTVDAVLDLIELTQTTPNPASVYRDPTKSRIIDPAKERLSRLYG